MQFVLLSTMHLEYCATGGKFAHYNQRSKGERTPTRRKDACCSISALKYTCHSTSIASGGSCTFFCNKPNLEEYLELGNDFDIPEGKDDR